MLFAQINEHGNNVLAVTAPANVKNYFSTEERINRLIVKTTPIKYKKPKKIVSTLPKKFQLSFMGDLGSKYGQRIDPFTGELKRHNGIDIKAPRGTPIYAPAPGIVTFAGWQRGYGNVVYIDHQNGYVTLFAHNKKNMVITGMHVTQLTKIGTVGSTGRATGPHIHLEVAHNGKRINPMTLRPTFLASREF